MPDFTVIPAAPGTVLINCYLAYEADPGSARLSEPPFCRLKLALKCQLLEFQRQNRHCSVFYQRLAKHRALQHAAGLSSGIIGEVSTVDISLIKPSHQAPDSRAGLSF